MNGKKLIIWALVFLVPGLGGLAVVYTFRHQQQMKIVENKQACKQNNAAGKYLDMYHQWSALTPEQKDENPWGQGDYGGSEIQRKILSNQGIRFEADVADLASGRKHPPELADMLYGVGWEKKLLSYRTRKEQLELANVGAGVVTMVGGGLFGIGVIVLLIGKIRDKNSFDETAQHQAAVIRNRVQSHKQACAQRKDSPVLYDREKHKTGQLSGHNQPAAKRQVGGAVANDPSRMNLSSSAGMQNFAWAGQETMAAVATMMTNEPVEEHVARGLNELTEEVSAIREFAAQQQDQMRKLQDGYDWVIIKRFCMRIIRCVDNVDDRVRLMLKNGEDVGDLEDIRDELVFALESSGVEQFAPKVRSSFKGQEKLAEAVRGRIMTDDVSLIGCIGEIIRPGYQYMISDDDVKIVRCAQVKLYDAE